MSAHGELAERLFTAIASGDGAAVTDLCAADAKLSQNGATGITMTELMALVTAVKSVVPDMRYENVVRSDTTDGFVEEHDAVGTLAGGTPLQIRACVVGRVENGKISELREYFDGGAFAPVVEALGM